MTTTLRLRTLFAAAASAVLVACGGGGGGGDAVAPAPTATTDIPDSARQSTSGLIAYLNTLIGMTSDTGEPVLVGDAVLPTDDTSEAVN